jgi:hypothetical protein
MERLKELIDLLNAQQEQKAEPAQMLQTVTLLEGELRRLATQPAPAKVMPTKIAVMMPSASKIYAGQPATTTPEPRKDLAGQRNGTANGTPAAGVNGSPNGTSLNGNNGAPVIPQQAPAAAPIHEKPAAPAPAAATLEVPPPGPYQRGQWPFDPLAEKPTDRFTLSQRSKEVNDVIGTGSSSLNDKLRSDVSDLKSALNDTPVRDLKKAIGVNDRYVFINQLFRGDEVMYERSLKTINSFRILPEAEYWMERELKVKLGWDENREATRHFYQIVKRRFS